MKKTLHDLLAAGKTAEVLSELQRLAQPDTGLHRQVMQLAARFAENERRRHSGTRTDDALGVELNKINEALLVVIGEMGKEESKMSEKPDNSSPKIVQKADKIYNIDHIDKADFH